MLTVANQKHVETLTERVDFTKKWLELSLGRPFDKLKDSRSSYNCDSEGNGYSYMMKLGGDDASTRFQLWVTARRNAERIDMFVGNDYIGENGVDITSISAYRKGNDQGKGNTYRNVPMYKVQEFFSINDLIIKKSRTTKKSESVTA